ncbi:Uncharacterized protein APZ42_020265 [Daphnia magna]|uniref:Uncharacterized protein n=1 Tax=Daphnia magna TaxID=35525 RepID=A0A164XMQ3_9CRUS|nr:Uncharacterized protein APZ42_020265 [Daphnia magna]
MWRKKKRNCYVKHLRVMTDCSFFSPGHESFCWCICERRKWKTHSFATELGLIYVDR